MPRRPARTWCAGLVRGRAPPGSRPCWSDAGGAGSPRPRGVLEFQASRIGARTGPAGEPVLLADQDRSRWNRGLIRRGSEALGRAGDGPYSLQAAIAACHAQAIRYEDTDWTAIAILYRRLMALTPSPVVELNRAVAVSMSEGPAAGLALVDALADEPALKNYHLLPSVRGDLLERLGRRDEARRSSRGRHR